MSNLRSPLFESQICNLFIAEGADVPYFSMMARQKQSQAAIIRFHTCLYYYPIHCQLLVP
jgi:hypothetical protein